MFREIIRQAKEEYNISLTAGDINHCDGCMSDTGRLFSGCINCTIRECNKSKGLENCGYCDKYPCEKLDEIFKSDPAAKTRLDFIHAVI